MIILGGCFCDFGNVFCWGGVVIIRLKCGVMEFWWRFVVKGWLVWGVEGRELVRGGGLWGLGSCDGAGGVGGMRAGGLHVWVVDFVGRGEEFH